MNIGKSVEQVWEDYLKTIGETLETTQMTYTHWHFGSTEELANELAELVITGKKKATAGSLWAYEYEEEEIPKIGDCSIIEDWNGKPKAIIMTTKVDIIPFNEVTEEFAAKEGEGDSGLDYWREGHRKFIKWDCIEIGREFTEDMPVVCQEFQVVYRVDEI